MLPNDQLTVIDLFAGAGGFSCGFEQTGTFKVILAVERDEHYRETYAANHPRVPHVLGDILDVIQDDNLEQIRHSTIKTYGDIDVIIGGPPCQGFSKANRQRNHLISTNNMLVTAYMKFVDKMNPKVFVMENVADMPKYSFYVSSGPSDEQALAKSGVVPSREEALLGHAREHVSDAEAFIRKHLGPSGAVRVPRCAGLVDQIYPRLRTLSNYCKGKKVDRANRFVLTNKTLFARISASLSSDPSSLPSYIYDDLRALLDRLAEGRMIRVRDYRTLTSVAEQLGILARLNEIAWSRIKTLDVVHKEDGSVFAVLESYNLADHLKGFFEQKGYVVGKKILEATHYGVPQRRERVFFIGVRGDVGVEEVLFPEAITVATPYTVRDAISDLADLVPSYKVEAEPVRVSFEGSSRPPLARLLHGGLSRIHNHIQTETTETALKRYRTLQQGQNFHALPASLTSSYSNKERTQRNVYCRLSYDAPSLTVTNVRKAMWVHPEVDRAVSVREAARLQSFPDSYEFHGRKNDQYQQVGNAVPPFLGRAVAEAVATMLGRNPTRTLQEELELHPPLSLCMPSASGVSTTA